MDAARWFLLVVGGCVVLAATPSAAEAQDRSTYVPNGLGATVETTHFVVHYDPGAVNVGYAQAGAADFEESFGRLVGGGGGTPNAGLKAPTADADGKTDVYIAAPLNKPGFRGGIVYRDSPPWRSSYMFLTPDLARDGFRFRAAHEFMHVIQNAYAFGFGDGLFEGFANWAAEFALPDVDPRDNNFFSAAEGNDVPHPWIPLDCSIGSWKGNGCGGGYWQWLFVQAQVEDYGPDFVPGYLQHFVDLLSADQPTKTAELLDHEIRAQSGGADNLRTRFARYALDVWDPTRWATGAIRKLRDEEGRTPASYFLTVADPDTGTQQVAIDHLAARYVEVFNYLAGARQGDLVEFTWQRPDGMAAPVVPLIKRVGQDGWTEAGGFDGTQGSAQLDFGPTVERVVLPLVNDSLNADDQPFSYRMRLIDAPAAVLPDTAILSHPPRRTSKHRAKFVFSAGEGTTFECALDKNRFAPCQSPKRVHVGVGAHRFAVRATDADGDVEAKPAEFAWLVTRR